MEMKSIIDYIFINNLMKFLSKLEQKRQNISLYDIKIQITIILQKLTDKK